MAETSNTYYSLDTRVFLILIPLINCINYYLTYTNISFDWFLVITFSIDTCMGYIAWLGIRKCIFYLDKKWSLNRYSLKKLIFQTSITLAIGIFIIAVLTELVSILVTGKFAPTHFYTRDLFIIGIWIFVVNGIYIGMYFYHHWYISASLIKHEKQIRTKGLLVNQGNKLLKLNPENILLITIDGDYSLIYTDDKKTYYHDQSLHQIMSNLSHQDFFRANRKFIVKREIIHGFSRIENGKLSVLIKKPYDVPYQITISRTKAASFKDWYQNG